MALNTPNITDASTSVSHPPAALPPSITKPAVIKHNAKKNKRVRKIRRDKRKEALLGARWFRALLKPRSISVVTSVPQLAQATFHAVTLRTFGNP